MSNNQSVKPISVQVDEDTCVKHKLFCCEECFDMTPLAIVTVEL